MSKDKDPAALKPCAICGEPASTRFRPFCSKRCADIDLSRWFRGQYRVPSEEPASNGNDEPAGGNVEGAPLEH